MTIIASLNTILGFIFLKESYAPIILTARCASLEKTHGGRYTFPSADDRPLTTRLRLSLLRSAASAAPLLPPRRGVRSSRRSRGHASAGGSLGSSVDPPQCHLA